MREKEISAVGLKEVINQVVAIPYNTAVGYYRMVGVNTDTGKFGDDCLGKLVQVKKALPITPISYLVTEFRGFHHVGAIVNNSYYIDPFLFLTEPVSLEAVRVKGEVTAATLADNQKVKVAVSGNNGLIVSLIRQFKRLPERTMIQYNFDLSQQRKQLPCDQEVTQLSAPYLFHFVSEGRHLRAIYDIGKDKWKIFLVNNDIGDEDFPVDEYFRKQLKNRYKLTLTELAQYFKEANNIQRYLLWQQRKNG